MLSAASGGPEELAESFPGPVEFRNHSGCDDKLAAELHARCSIPRHGVKGCQGSERDQKGFDHWGKVGWAILSAADDWERLISAPSSASPGIATEIWLAAEAYSAAEAARSRVKSLGNVRLIRASKSFIAQFGLPGREGHWLAQVMHLHRRSSFRSRHQTHWSHWTQPTLSGGRSDSKITRFGASSAASDCRPPLLMIPFLLPAQKGGCGEGQMIAYAQALLTSGGRPLRKEFDLYAYGQPERIPLRLRVGLAIGSASALWAGIGLSIWSLAI